jgi:hypothetical protein
VQTQHRQQIMVAFREIVYTAMEDNSVIAFVSYSKRPVIKNVAGILMIGGHGEHYGAIVSDKCLL